MKTKLFSTELGDGIYRISDSLHGPNEDGKSSAFGKATQNSYLIKGEKKAVLIDLAVDNKNLYSFAKELAGTEVDVVITHGHPDHVFHLDSVPFAFIHPLDIPLVRNGLNGLYKGNTTTPLKPLNDGDIIELGNREVEVINIPGHTMGSILLLDKKTRTLFSGDTAARRLLYGLSKTVSLKRHTEYLECLKKKDFDTLYSAHDRAPIKKNYIDFIIKNIREDLPLSKESVKLPLKLGYMRNLHIGKEEEELYFDAAVTEEYMGNVKEGDKTTFLDTSILKETVGIRERSTKDYVEKKLKELLPNENFRVKSVTLNETGKYEAKSNILVKLLWNNGKVKDLPPFIDVRIEHCTGTEWENIIVWTPLSWNDRFMGTCGGGTCTGGDEQISSPNNAQRSMTLPFAIINGFSASTCDAGNTKYGQNWAIDKETGKVKDERIENWRVRATHYMTLFGKAVTEILHERKIKFSYLHGGSGGGRQSLSEAQNYPNDYDGIWASCPAINWNKFLVTGLWPIALENEYKTKLNYYKLEYVSTKVHESVGGKEAFFMKKEKTDFDPFTLVGDKTKGGIITKEDAALFRDLWDGPRRKNGERLWYAFRTGGEYYCTGLPIFAISFLRKNGKARVFNLCTIYARWALGDTKKKFDKIDKREFEEIFDKVNSTFPLANIDNPDLTPFFSKGGKVMIDHGTDDPLIPVDGTLDYVRKVKDSVSPELFKNLTLYIGEGDNHGNCIGNGPGISESDGVCAMMNWVEKGIKPNTIRVVQVNRKTGATVTERTRNPYEV